ncbi:sodium-dependent glucose transporter 1-like protein [Dinothrombium tinctorium]|uniref:Sodium-dependent glucose transporter 1-like protein n=1 Tax=Dinothrombium tinctorium TaxID=1965070 RepID=A0A443R5S8_9ACAR|nr:sodium-dependent glucose transporter 1-like protein [Dinothrombium tinctorium]RWS14066.1 sodium-dependent glucose transporter 1-like protein [Dinothrombium tinctorium]
MSDLKQKLAKSTITCLIPFFTCATILSTAIAQIDLVNLLKSSAYDLVASLLLQNFTLCLGTLAAPILYKLCHKLAVCGTSLIICGTLYALISNSQTLASYYCFTLLLGFVSGLIVPSTYVLMSKIWKEKSGPFVHSISLSFVLSTIVVPLIFKPFVTKKIITYPSCDETIFESESSQLNATESKCFDGKDSRIWIPYSMIGLCAIILGILTLAFHFYTRGESKVEVKNYGEKKNKQKEIENTTANLNVQFRKIAITAVTLAIFAQYGLIISIIQFWVVFIVHYDFNYLKKEALSVLVTFSLSAIMSSIFAIAMSTKFKAELVFHLISTVIASGALIQLFLANSTRALSLISVMIVAFHFGAAPSATFNCLSKRFKTSHLLVSLLMLAITIPGATGVTVIMGFHFESFPITIISLLVAISDALFSLLLKLSDKSQKVV